MNNPGLIMRKDNDKDTRRKKQFQKCLKSKKIYLLIY